MVSEGFQRGLKSSLFLKKAPKVCYRSRRLVLLHTASPRPSRGVEWWFQRGFRGVWNRVVLGEGFQRSETVRFQKGFRGVWNRVVSERFQRGLKPCGFRGVSERVWNPPFFKKKAPKCLYDSFWIIWCLKIGWNRSRRLVLLHTASPRPSRRPVMVSEGFQRGLKPSLFQKKAPKSLYDSFWIIWRLEIVKFCRWNPWRPVLLHTASARPSRGVPRWFQRVSKRFQRVSEGFQRGFGGGSNPLVLGLPLAIWQDHPMA